MAAARNRWLVLAGGVVLAGTLLLGRGAGQPPPVESQAVSPGERMEQLDARVAALEARVAALESVVGVPSPATAAQLTAYRESFTAIVDAYDRYQQQVRTAVDSGASSTELQALADQGALLYRSLALRIRTLATPPCYTATQSALLQAAGLFEGAATFGVGTAATIATENMLVAALQQARQAFAAARC